MATPTEPRRRRRWRERLGTWLADIELSWIFAFLAAILLAALLALSSAAAH